LMSKYFSKILLYTSFLALVLSDASVAFITEVRMPDMLIRKREN
jgi:hypothetical protein